jgi:plastocyanin
MGNQTSQQTWKASFRQGGQRTLVLLGMIAAFVLAPQIIGSERAHGRPVASTVRGRIELVNSKLKPRDGLVDASGVALWLTPLDGAPPRGPAKPRASINQRNKRFTPHVVVVETGSLVDFPNSDPFFHNVFSVFNGKRFDLGLYASGETRPVNFNRPGISYIFCNIHPQMSAVVLALDSPYYAITDRAGNFTIAGVPEGRYRLQLWHERAKSETLDALTREINVRGETLDLGVLSLSEAGYLERPHPNKHGQEYDQQPNKPGYRKP